MKRFVITLFAIFAIMATIQSCTESNATKSSNVQPTKSPLIETSTPVDVATLEAMGFTSSIDVVIMKAHSEKEKWAKKGLVFISEGEVQNYLNENDFILGPSERYIGNIPEDAARKLVKNYQLFMKVSSGKIYVDRIGRSWTQVELDKMSETDRNWVLNWHTATEGAVFVAAPAKKFNTEGMIITDRQLKVNHPDPKALCKVNEGYIELASW